MVTTGESIIQVKKERSYISCLIKGCGYGFKHLGLLLRYMWPSLLLASLLPIPFICFYGGQMDAILRKWTELGYVPNTTLKAMKGEVTRCSIRNVFNLLLTLLFALLLAVIMCLPIFVGLSFGWCLLIGLIVSAILVPFLSAITLQISFSDFSLGRCFPEGLWMGYKNFGRLFAFELLEFLIVLPIYIIANIPNAIVSGVCLQAYNGYIMGDTIDLPVIFPIVAYLNFVVVMGIILVTYLVINFSRCLMWGSLVDEVPTEAEANS